MGYWTPPAAAPPQCAVAAMVAVKSMWAEHSAPHLSSGGVEGSGCTGPVVGLCAACCLPWPVSPPFELGEGSAGPCRVPSRWGIGACVHRVCVWSDPCGVVSLGVKRGRCWGCDIWLALASPALQSWGGRAYCACPLPMNCNRWWHVVMVGAALLESVIPSMLSVRVAD